MKLFTKRKGITINLSTEAVVRTIVLVIVAFLFINFIDKISHELELFAISIFLALALNPAVSWLSRRLKIKSRVWATGLAYVVVLTLLVGFLALVLPPLVRQTNSFIKTVPNTAKSLKDENSQTGRFVQRYHLQSQVDKASDEVSSRLSDVPSLVVGAASRVGGAFIATITVVVLTFMMLVEGPLWIKRFYALTPEDKRETYQELGHKMYRIVTGYVNGQVFIAILAALFAFVALTIGTQLTDASVNTVAMAAIVFLFGLIPLIGNTIAAIIVVIVCAFSSIPLAIGLAVYFPVYQQIENATLQPHIQAKNNQLTPLLVFMAALIGAGFGGLLGAFVAIPLAGCLRILFEHRFGDKMMPTAEKVEKSRS